MFNSDFYPTPAHVIDQMLSGIDVTGRTILEPSAGSGHLVKAIQQAGAREVLACENDPNLVKIARTYCNVICEDFLQLKSEQISHIDAILMNPPFSRGADHILHAFNIAPDGCQIVALCNWETIKNPYSKSREQLKAIIDQYGQATELGKAFRTAERQTEVEVALIRLQKPGNDYKTEFAGFFMDEDPEEHQANGLMSYNAVRDLVNRYVECIKIYDQQIQTAVKLNELQRDYFDTSSDINDPKGEISISINQGGTQIARNEFKKRMQRSGWSWIFQKMNLTKTATKGLREDINRFVETQQNVPFTMRNIYHMLDMVIQTTGQRMDKAIIEVFDKIIRHSDDNKYGLPGWKTNSHYLLTRKFIYPYVSDVNAYRWGRSFGATGESSFTIYRSSCESIEDMEKALCYITGENFDEIKCVWQSSNNDTYGEWHESHFFRYKGFKKGTVHFEFKSEDVWAAFNQRVAKIKGYPLPETRQQTAYQKRQTHTRNAEPMIRKDQKPSKPVVLATFEV